MKCRPLRLMTLAIAFLFFSQVRPGVVAAESLRYLFLIDHSPEMATRQIATVQTIYDIIRSGFENEIKPGENFALWFYGSRLQTNAPFTWQPGQETALARQAANLFTGRIYSRLRPREQTLADAAPFIAASPQITIFIVTDGSQPLMGTPFDAKINAPMSEKRALFRSADKPFVITLMARRGNWADADVFTSPTEKFQIPEFDRQDEPMAQALAAVRSAPGPSAVKLDPGEMDKALAALRGASTRTEQNSGAGQEFDKARLALRDALAGKQTGEAAPAAKMQFAPTLKQPDQPNLEKEQAARPQTIADDSGALPKSNPTLPPTIARPPEAVVPVRTVAEPKPEAKPEPKLVETGSVEQKPTQPATTPAHEPGTQQIPATAEAPVQDRPVMQRAAEPLKPVKQPTTNTRREEPKSSNPEPTRAAPQPVAASQTPKPSLAQTGPRIAEPTQLASKRPVEQSHSLERANPAPLVAQPAVVTPPAKPFPWLLLSLGFASIAIGGAFALAHVVKRSKSPGSIITQALPRSESPRRRI